MSVDLYFMSLSSPCRSVVMAAKALGVTVNLKETHTMNGETRTPEFMKMNLQHTIPTLDDGGFCLNESRAMLQYLANKYGKDDKLYPKDPVARAKVDMKLFFDMGTLYSRFADAYYPTVFAKQPIDEEKMTKLDEALGFLEEYLAEGYVAGGHLTIADFALCASLTTMEACGHDMSKFSKVTDYLAKLKGEIEGYQELNQVGADAFGAIAKPALNRA